MQAYEDDLCVCGTPRTYGFDADADRRYRVHDATCHACAALDRTQNPSKKPKPGHRQYVVPDDALIYAMHHPIHVPPVDT